MHQYDLSLPSQAVRSSALRQDGVLILSMIPHPGCFLLLCSTVGVACGGKSETSGSEGSEDAVEQVPEVTGSGGAQSEGDEAVQADLPIGAQGLPVFVGSESLGERAAGETDSTGREGAYALFADAASPRAVLSTHLPSYNFGTAFQTVEFSARASRPVHLKVSVSPIQTSYWDALEKGQAWQGSMVDVSENWRDISLPFAEMGPLAEGVPQPLGTDEGSAFSIILEESEEVTVWVADIVMIP